LPEEGAGAAVGEGDASEGGVVVGERYEGNESIVGEGAVQGGGGAGRKRLRPGGGRLVRIDESDVRSCRQGYELGGGALTATEIQWHGRARNEREVERACKEGTREHMRKMQKRSRGP